MRPTNLYVFLDIFTDITDERNRQEQLKESGKFATTCSDDATQNSACLSVLVEEVGEVARALNDQKMGSDIRAELVQVAAVCVAWIEKLDRAV